MALKKRVSIQNKTHTKTKTRSGSGNINPVRQTHAQHLTARADFLIGETKNPSFKIQPLKRRRIKKHVNTAEA